MKVLTAPQCGSYQGITASHNTFGQYVRSRRTPVNPNSTQQGVVRARMAANAANWRTLTSAQRAGWTALALSMNRTDSLGQTYTLNGFLAFCSVNNNLGVAGVANVTDAPALVTPAAILTAVITLSATVLSIVYTVSPLAAAEKLLSFVSPQRSAGRSYEGDFRLIAVSAAAAASPANLFAAYVAKFGTPVVGNRIFFSLTTTASGFTSGPLITSAVVA